MTYRKNPSGYLYLFARIVRWAEVLLTGDPKKIGRHLKNQALNQLYWRGINKLEHIRRRK